jgi:hypothetical protein
MGLNSFFFGVTLIHDTSHGSAEGVNAGCLLTLNKRFHVIPNFLVMGTVIPVSELHLLHYCAKVNIPLNRIFSHGLYIYFFLFKN